jgi:hypothetical protein
MSTVAKEKNKQTETSPAYSTTSGNYNRISGTKTLRFVGVIIALIAILSILLLWEMSIKR